MSVRLDESFEQAVTRTRDALSQQGFGVLTEIDVRATMRAKLDVEFENYLILGACNPPLARDALTVDRQIGVLLPCNVVVREDGDQVVVEALNPALMVEVTGREELNPMAAEARARLTAALEALTAGS